MPKNKIISSLITLLVMVLFLISGCSQTTVNTTPIQSATQTPTLTPFLTTTPTATPIPNPTYTQPATLTQALPPLPSDDKDAVDDSIVVVWGTDGNNATGVVIGDGTQVLTAWDFEASTADSFKILAPGGMSYQSSIQAFDSRNSLMLLKIEGMKLPPASIGDLQTIKTGQEVIAREWNLTSEFNKVQVLASVYSDTFPVLFELKYPSDVIYKNKAERINQGAIVTDVQGSVLGVVGVDYMTLMPHPHPFLFVPSVAGVIPAAGVLSSNATQQLWGNGPLQIITANQFGTRSGGYFQTYDALTQALKELENNLGAPLAAGELKEYLRMGTSSSDGTTLTTTYAWPVNLLSSDGKILTSAKWVGIHWNRSDNKPNRLFYGSKTSTIDGGFLRAGNVNNLAQIVLPLIPNGTVTAPTPQ